MGATSFLWRQGPDMPNYADTKLAEDNSYYHQNHMKFGVWTENEFDPGNMEILTWDRDGLLFLAVLDPEIRQQWFVSTH